VENEEEALTHRIFKTNLAENLAPYGMEFDEKSFL
jgi:hypothetical protein